MATFLQDLRYGLRGLRQRPGFTLAAVLALALGLGANTAIFTVADAVVLSPLPYPEPERLVALWETNAAQGLDHERLSPVNFVDFHGLGQVFEDAAAWWNPELNLTDERGEPVRVTAIEASGNFFSVMGVEPRLGRGFAAGDPFSEGAPEVVISDRLWRGRYGSDEGLVGRAVNLDGRPFTVVGVMPPGFQFPGETDVWQRLEWNLANHSRYAHFMEAVGRLRPGVPVERARAELAALAGRLAAENTGSNKGWGVRAAPLQEEVVGSYGPALLVLVGAVGLLLLLACANVANLLLAQASAREREVAIRAALGAGRGRLLTQFLAESLLLALGGAALGLALAWAGLRLLVASRAVELPRLAELTLDGRMLAFGLGAALLTVLLFGLAPALQMVGGDLHAPLKEGGRGAGAGRSGRRTRSVLVVAEMALAVVLLVGAGLLARSFLRLLEEEPGFQPERVVTVDLQLPESLYDDWGRVGRFYDELVGRLAAHPALEKAGATGFLPLEPGWRIPYEIPGRPPAAPGEEPEAQYVTVSAGYFETLGVPLLAGRTFDRRDVAGSRQAVVINRELARRAWPDRAEGEAVGRILLSGTNGIGPLGRTLSQEPEYEVIGVVGDVKNAELGDAPEPAAYFVQSQFPYRNMNLVVRGRGTVAQLGAVVRAEVRRLDAGLALSEVRPLAAVLDQATAQSRFLLGLMGGFALLALVLAAVGIYGVLSYAVSRRRGEMGIRQALGASPGRVRRLVVGEGMLLATAGLALGAFAAAGLARFLAGLLHGVEPHDALAFTAAAALLLAVAFAACYLPARRASEVDPLEALRSE